MKVLLLEDEKMLQSSIAEYLNEIGYIVNVSEDGLEAYEEVLGRVRENLSWAHSLMNSAHPVKEVFFSDHSRENLIDEVKLFANAKERPRPKI